MRFFLKDILSQAQQARKYFEQAKKGKIKLIVLPIVIFEIVFALESIYILRRKEIIKFIKAIILMRYIDIDQRDIFLEALDLYGRQNVDLVDTFLFCKAKNQGGEVLSFDRDFRKLKKTYLGN